MDERQFGLKAPLPRQPQGTPAGGLIWAPTVGDLPNLGRRCSLRSRSEDGGGGTYLHNHFHQLRLSEHLARLLLKGSELSGSQVFLWR